MNLETVLILKMFSKNNYCLFQQKLNGFLCDINVCVEDTVVIGHACVFASCSLYFKEVLQSSWEDQLSWPDHWCTRRPLVVDLNKSITDTQDKCALCVSNIIDYMYTKEIVVGKGHVQHFSKIVAFLGIFDLFSFCKKHVSDVNSEVCSKKSEVSINYSSKDFKTNKNKTEVQKKDKESLTLGPQNCLVPTIVPEPISVAILNTKDNCVDVKDVNKELILELHNTKKDNNPNCEAKINRICEFPCCKVDENPPTFHGKQCKRKMLCEICSHSAVSVQKMVKHIENSNHFGYVCPICKLTVKKLQVHLKEHLGPKPYLCPVCNKRSKFLEYHKLHLKTHCLNKKFCCEVCLKRFKRQQNLAEHLKSHLFDHKSNMPSKSGEITRFDDGGNDVPNKITKHTTSKEFFCQVCSKTFSKKKNLARHSQLIHQSALSYNCSNCSYETKRTDLLKNHMIKHHNTSHDEIKQLTLIAKKKNSKTLKQNFSNVIEVMIPIKLISTNNESTTLNAFAVNSCTNDSSQKSECNKKQSVVIDEEEEISSAVSDVNQSVWISSSELNSVEKNGLDSASNITNINLPSSVAEYPDKKKRLFRPTVNTELYLSESDGNRSQARVEFPTSSKVVLDNGQAVTGTGDLSNLHFVLEKANDRVVPRDSSVLLNEATGEFLCSVQVLDTNYTTETSDPSHTHGLILSSESNGISVYDVEKDIDQFQSNPQTPLTNVVELDDSDNLFPWNCLDNTFCSTWVLNEATGELNMVSFSVEPLKHSDELQLDENTGIFSSKDDDETALFLNEGTGDLSVIYFNPKHTSVEQVNQEKCEVFDNVSEHSNEDEDLLNEEFFKATASFMAHEENEIFLNELTGEFDVAHLETQQQDIFESQIAISESYLNEETGEISWNVLSNIESSLFTNSKNFQYDFDDSLNCDDLDPFPATSHFCLDKKSQCDWQPIEDVCDILLNECTGELVKKN